MSGLFVAVGGVECGSFIMAVIYFCFFQHVKNFLCCLIMYHYVLVLIWVVVLSGLLVFVGGDSSVAV